MKLRALILFATGLLFVLLAFGQGYSPKAGETVMRIDVEGKGSIFVRLHTDKAPRATAQIIRLARQGFYNGQRWFRVVHKPRPFLIQTGDPQSRDASKLEAETMGTQGSGNKVPFEATGLPAKEGAVCLASLPGDRDSGDSQFFILLGNYRFLEGDHTVFGEVVAGMNVVHSVAKGDLITSVRIIGG